MLKHPHLVALIRHIRIREIYSCECDEALNSDGELDYDSDYCTECNGMLEPNVKQKEAAEWYKALSKLLQGSKAVVSIDVGSTHYGDRAPREYGSLLRSVVTSSTITSIKFRDLAFGAACKDSNPAKSPSLAPDMVTSAIQKICFMEKGPMRNSEFLETIFSLSNFSNIRDLTITTKLRMETNGYSLPNSNPGFWRSIRRLSLRLNAGHYAVFISWMEACKKALQKEELDGPVLRLEHLDVNFPPPSDQLGFLQAFSTPSVTSLSIGIGIPSLATLDPAVLGSLADLFPFLKKLVLYGHKANDVTHLVVGFELHQSLENLVLKDILVEEGKPLEAMSGDGLTETEIQSIKRHKFSERVQRTGILEFATRGLSLKTLTERGLEHEYSWDVMRAKGVVELQPRMIETWVWGERERKAREERAEMEYFHQLRRERIRKLG